MLLLVDAMVLPDAEEKTDSTGDGGPELPARLNKRVRAGDESRSSRGDRFVRCRVSAV